MRFALPTESSCLAIARQRRRGQRSARGFTLVELMFVITIMIILISMAIPRLHNSEVYAREAALRQDLFTLRQAIQSYTLDKQAAPQSLDDLVSGGYISAVPKDPMTRNTDWTTENTDMVLSPDQTTTGISDVHSASNDTSPFDDSAYSSW
jgi:general secretion pathway protein G